MQRFLNEESVGESCLSGFPLSDGARPVHPGGSNWVSNPGN